jgi:transposase
MMKKVKNHPWTDLLESIPGIGLMTISAIIAYMGDISRFHDSRSVCSYFGLVPRVRESGEQKGGSRITKCGNSLLRGYLLQGALTILRYKSKPETIGFIDFYTGIKIRRGWKKARVALARKLLSVAFGVIKHHQCFDPKKMTSFKEAA